MKYIPSLNGLRALSVLLVILCHIELYYRYVVHDPVSEALFFFYNGQLGVNVFFVLSGFLITRLLLQEEEQTQTVSLRRFYFRRTLRIFPAYYFLLLVYFFLQRAGLIEISPASWWRALTYTKNIANDEWFTRHAWSLSLEEQFYLLWPLLFTCFPRFRNRIAMALVVLAPLLRMVDYLRPTHGLGNTDGLQRIDALLWGCLFAIYHGPILRWLKAVFHKYKWAVAVPFVVFVGSYYFTQLNMHCGFKLGTAIVGFGGENGTFLYLSIGAILFYSVYFQQTAWYRFLNHPAVNYVGKLSYSIYLWQQLFIATDLYRSGFLLNFVCIFAAANVSYHAIEKPILSLRARLEEKLWRARPVFRFSSQTGR